MRESSAVDDALVQFADRLSAGDVDSFDRLVSSDPATCIVGTAPGEVVTERAALRFGFETEGVRLEIDPPRAYEEGSVGWALTAGTLFFPDGSGIPVRLSAVLHQQEDRWKLVHAHFSVGVPDEEVVTLTKSWSS